MIVQAKLSPGLRHESGVSKANEENLFEQTLAVIPAGERFVMEPLVADTTQGGEQSCEVVVQSQDVVANGPEAHSKCTVTVIEPQLKMAMTGPDKRYTDMLATYEITLTNPGTAPARGVRVYATMPTGGRLHEAPPGAAFDPQSRKLTWSRPQLDPGEKATMSFKVRTGSIGIYQVAAEARAETGLLAKDTISTDVSGLADVDLDVTESRRAVDVGETTVYKIRVANRGTKEATKIAVSAQIPDTVEPVESSGTEEGGRFSGPPKRLFVFPIIDRLGPGKQVELGIKVEAKTPGVASCRVFLTHDDMVEKLEDLAVFKVEKARR